MLNLPFTIRQLQIFAELSEALSFRECADRLGISQAAVSNQIALLESQLGFRLFIRRAGMRPRLTAGGLAFLADLKSFDAAGRDLASHRKNRSGSGSQRTFKILIGQSLFDSFVRPRLDELFVRHPNLTCEFEARVPSDDVEREIESAEADFAMIHQLSDTPLSTRWQKLALVSSGVYGTLQLAKDPAIPMSPDEVSALPFILPKAGSRAEETLLQDLAARGVVPRNVIGNSEYLDVIVAMVERGLGVACLAEPSLAPKSRERIACFFPLSTWRLQWFNRHPKSDPEAGQVQQFLFDCVVLAPNYPAIERFV